jgi:hypothetical protein
LMGICSLAYRHTVCQGECNPWHQKTNLKGERGHVKHHCKAAEKDAVSLPVKSNAIRFSDLPLNW